MLFIRSAGLMAGHTPMRFPTAEQLAGNHFQYNMLGRTTDPIPYSMWGKLTRSAAPFPWFINANPFGPREPSQQVLPAKPPPGWLPQSTYRYYGRFGVEENAPAGGGKFL